MHQKCVSVQCDERFQFHIIMKDVFMQLMFFFYKALDDDLKWVLSKNDNNYINFKYSLMLTVPLITSDVFL